MHRSNHNFDLNTLTIFRRVVELNSLSKAAEELAINPSTVSRKISDLESFYGVKLLLRTTRTLTLTEEGKAFYGYCQNIEDLLVRSENEITNTQIEATGVLRVVIPVDIGNLALIDALNEFAIKYPKVVLELEFSNRTVDVVEEGVDIWFCVGEASNQSLISKRVMTYKRYLMASKSYIAQFGEIHSVSDIVQPHRQVKNTNPFNYKDRNAIKHLPYSVAVNSSYAVMQSCLAGLGLAYIARSLTNKYDVENQLVLVLGEELASEAIISMVYPERKLKPMRTEYFLNFISDYFRYI
ncbi:transcriptional regulator [Vibrio sp. 10N.286.49.C2]|uniref:LysR family transcriptional regulator n=1 Tax=unclassified Vibrio TaxID=2614977 RepID=UPI000C832339|nr:MULTISPECIES: LysR family transcriptional regulator [unclassified Vibrio]PMH33877.1 transcriptional regulator [Vibrio sp. 10N.286.49.C2]PMH44135.1 transcriptional regulator [Vibrio sp. 10N.286.49.B1]PMH82663.1 transcriptional regulator [Vibrio sp. 10N.286.48.B7]